MFLPPPFFPIPASPISSRFISPPTVPPLAALAPHPAPLATPPAALVHLNELRPAYKHTAYERSHGWQPFPESGRQQDPPGGDKEGGGRALDRRL